MNDFGLYLVMTDPAVGYAKCAEAAVKAGVKIIQLRMKKASREDILREAREVRRVTSGTDTLFIVNDDPALAAEVMADGVHVGQDDMEAASVRSILGSDMIVGVTAKTVQQAIRAEEAGADYLGSGAVFGSSTKLNAKPMTKELLNAICHAVSIPVVAIGGINRDPV
jgi:thiamine-phosphate diphosphorylase